MKKTLISACSIFFALALISSAAYPWGSATHAYIADHLGKKWGLKNSNELYGAMAPDIFNYAFGLPDELLIYLKKFTHGIPPEEDSFLDVWYNARWWGLEKAVAYGYVSHNDVWGADFTAHWKGVSIPTGDYPEGYIIAKARLLDSMILAAIGDPPAPDDLIGQIYVYVLDPQTREDICHDIVEAAGDILIKREANRIGNKIIFSALLRSSSFPDLLVRAIGEDYRALIIPAEKEFRKMMVLYGAALLQDEEAAIDSLSGQMAELSIAYLESKGYTLPEEVTIEDIKSFIVNATYASFAILYDYMDEIEATINFVKFNLWSNRIFYW